MSKNRKAQDTTKESEDEFEYVEEPETEFRKNVAVVRKHVFGYWKQFDEANKKVVEAAKEYEKQYNFPVIRDAWNCADKKLHERPGLTLVSGVGGLTFYSFRKSRPYLLAPLTMTAIASSLAFSAVYPAEAKKLLETHGKPLVTVAMNNEDWRTKLAQARAALWGSKAEVQETASEKNKTK